MVAMNGKSKKPRIGSREFFKRWGEGIQKITPEQLVKIELIGLYGNIIGTIAVCICLILFVKTLWFIMFAFVFSIFIHTSQLINAYQKLKALKTVEAISKQVNLDELFKK